MPASAALGRVDEIDLGGARLRYHDRGEGPPVVFVHGLLANAYLWRKVVPGIAAAGYRCLAPDWPLGAHAVPVPHADLTPTGVADLVASFLRELNLEDVTVVANDTGGAITQILMARNPDLVARVVLTPSDCYDQFLPSFLKALTQVARMPGSVRLATEALRIRALHPLPIGFGWLVKRPLPVEVMDVHLQPSRRDRRSAGTCVASSGRWTSPTRCRRRRPSPASPSPYCSRGPARTASSRSAWRTGLRRTCRTPP